MNAGSALPTILLAFANDRRPSEGDWLRDLVEERRELSDLLDDAMTHGPLAGRFAVQLEPNLTLDDLQKCVARLGPQLIGVHFGGHADPEALRLEDRTGHPAPLPADALAEALSGCPALRWVFLNGCSTARHVEALAAATRAAVIATTSSVEDDVARRFARAVYRGLLDGRPLDAAFAGAESSVLAVRSRASLHRGGLARGVRMLRPAAAPRPDPVPWFLRSSPAAPGWSLAGELARWGLGRHLDPGRYDLPSRPTADALISFEHALSPLIGAHVAEAFAALDAWADSDAAVAVRQVAGGPWSGKSRLLAEWMARRAEPLTGFVPAGLADGWLADLARVRAAIVTLDDAAERADIADVLAVAARRPPDAGRLRIVLVERDPGWSSRLRGLDGGARRLLAEAAAPLVITPALPPAERPAVFADLSARLAEHLPAASPGSTALDDDRFAAPGWLLVAALDAAEGRPVDADAVARRITRSSEADVLDLELDIADDHWQARMGPLAWRIEHPITRPADDPEHQGLRESVATLLAAGRRRVIRPTRYATPEEEAATAALQARAAELGRALTAALFDDVAARRLARAVGQAEPETPAILRLRVRGADDGRLDAALAWPWELVWSADGHPVADGRLHIVREVVRPGDVDPPRLDAPLTVLAAVATAADSPFDDGDPAVGLLRAVAAGHEAVHLAPTGEMEGLIDAVTAYRPRVVQLLATADPDTLWLEAHGTPGEGHRPESLVHSLHGRRAATPPELVVLGLARPDDGGDALRGDQAFNGRGDWGRDARRAPLEFAAAAHRAGVDQLIAYTGPLDSPQAAASLARIHDALAAGASPIAAVCAARRASVYLASEGGDQVSALPLAWVHLTHFARVPDRPLTHAIEGAPGHWQAALEADRAPLPEPGPGQPPSAPLRAFAGRRAERLAALHRWAHEQALVVVGLAGLGKSAFCADIAPHLAARLGAAARVLAVDAADRADLSAALEAAGPVLVHVDGLDAALDPQSAFVDAELAQRWAAAVRRAAAEPTFGLLASSRVAPSGPASLPVLHLTALTPAASVRVIGALPTLGRLSPDDRRWLADRAHGHPETLRRLDRAADHIERRVAARQVGADAHYAGDDWRHDILEPTLAQVLPTVTRAADCAPLLAAAPPAVSRHRAACAVLESPVPWSAVVALGDARTAAALADAGLLTPTAMPHGRQPGWAPHPYARPDDALSAEERRAAHEAVGRELLTHASTTAADHAGRLAVEQLLRAGLPDDAWPPARLQINWMRETGRADEALALARRVLDAGPGPRVRAWAGVFRVQLELARGAAPGDAEAMLDAAAPHLDADGRLLALSTRANLKAHAGRWAEAAELFRQCITLAEAGEPEDADRLLINLHGNLGRCQRALGDLTGALTAHRAAIERARRLPAERAAAELFDPLREAGRLLVQLGDVSGGRDHLLEALTHARTVWRTDRHLDVIRCLVELGELAVRGGDAVSARAWLEHAHGLIAEVPGAQRDACASRCLMALAGLRMAHDRPAACGLLRAAVQSAEALPGDPEINAAEARYHLGQAATALGDFDAAEEALSRAEAAYARAYGADGPHRFSVSLARAHLERHRGDLAASIDRCRALVDEAEAAGQRVFVEPALVAWGLAAKLAGQLDVACAVWRRALEGMAQEGPHWRSAQLLGRLGEALTEAGRPLEACAALDQAVSVSLALCGTDEDPQVVRALLQLGVARHFAGVEPDHGRETFERILRILPALDDDERLPLAAATHVRLAHLAEGESRLASASQHLRAALASRAAMGDTTSLDGVVELELSLGRVEQGRVHPEQALPHWRRSAELCEGAADPRAAGRLVRALMGLGSSLADLGEHREARDAFAQALRIVEQAPAEGMPPRVDVRVAFAAALTGGGAHHEALAILSDEALSAPDLAAELAADAVSSARRHQIRSRAYGGLLQLEAAAEAAGRAIADLARAAVVPDERARAHLELGDLLCTGLGRPDDAAEQLRLAEQALIGTEPSGAHWLAQRLRARVYLFRGQFAEALEAFAAVQALGRTLHGEFTRPAEALVAQHMAAAHLGAGDPVTAVATAERAVALWTEAMGTARHRRVIEALQVLGWIQREAGDTAGAQATVERALAHLNALAVTPDTEGVVARMNATLALPLAADLADRGDLAQARRVLDAAAERLAAILPPSSGERRLARQQRRRLDFGLAGPGAPPGSLPAVSDALLQGDTADARILLEALLDGPDGPRARVMLGTLLAMAGDADAARPLLPTDAG